MPPASQTQHQLHPLPCPVSPPAICEPPCSLGGCILSIQLHTQYSAAYSTCSRMLSMHLNVEYAASCSEEHLLLPCQIRQTLGSTASRFMITTVRFVQDLFGLVAAGGLMIAAFVRSGASSALGSPCCTHSAAPALTGGLVHERMHTLL